MADHAADPGHADPNQAAAAAAAAANQWASVLAAWNPYLPEVIIFHRSIYRLASATCLQKSERFFQTIFFQGLNSV